MSTTIISSWKYNINNEMKDSEAANLKVESYTYKRGSLKTQVSMT